MPGSENSSPWTVLLATISFVVVVATAILGLLPFRVGPAIFLHGFFGLILVATLGVIARPDLRSILGRWRSWKGLVVLVVVALLATAVCVFAPPGRGGPPMGPEEFGEMGPPPPPGGSGGPP